MGESASLRRHAEKPGAERDRPQSARSRVPGGAGGLLAGAGPVFRLDAAATGDDAIRDGLASPAGSLPHGELIQAAFGGHSLADVRAHVGAEATASAAALGAVAYTRGRHIVFGGPPSLQTAAHEAAHVVQQRRWVRSVGGRPDPVYERHADAVAERVVARRPAQDLLAGTPAGGAPAIGPGSAPPVVQFQIGHAGKVLHHALLPARAVSSIVGGVFRAFGVQNAPGMYKSTTKGALSAELLAGLKLAQAHPAPKSIKGAVPAWVTPGINAWLAAKWAKKTAKQQANKAATFQQTYINKWGSPHENRKGLLPGLAFAGGYQEYYAEPPKGQLIWGSNRIVRQGRLSDPTGPYWWASDNHYNSYMYIRDA